MSGLTVFENPEFGELRTAEINGRTRVCLADVCRPLGIRANDCRTRLKEDGTDTIVTVDSSGRQNRMIFINEGNLYRAIFQSRKPEAERFTDWVTEEVLPALRKAGQYQMKPMSPAEQLAAQANLLVELERRQEALEQRVDRAVAALARPEQDDWTAEMKEAIAAYCRETGLTDAAGRGRLYAALDREAGCSTDARLRNLRERRRKAGERRKDYMALTKLDAIALDSVLRSAFEGIVARERARAAGKT